MNTKISWSSFLCGKLNLWELYFNVKYEINEHHTVTDIFQIKCNPLQTLIKLPDYKSDIKGLVAWAKILFGIIQYIYTRKIGHM